MTNESTYGMGKHTPAATTPGEWMKEAERLAHEMQRKYHHAMQMQAFADKDEKDCTLAENVQRAGIARAAWLNYHNVRADLLAHLRLRADTPAAPVSGDAGKDIAQAKIIANKAQRFADDRLHLGDRIYVNDLVWALKILAAPSQQQVGGQFDVVDHFTPPAPDQFTAGVNAAAAMLDKKADAYAHEHSTQDSDTGVWEFGRHGEDYYNTLRELADDVRSIVRGDPAPEGPAVGDLVLLVNRLAHSLKKANPDSDLPAKAADYLKRHSLGSSLRATPPAQPAPSDIFDAMNLPPVSTFPGVKP